VVPLQLSWDGKRYLDSIDLTVDDFYERLNNSKTLPTTSQPSPEQFKQAFEEELAKGNDVLAVVVSSKLSGTYNSAIQAKNALNSKKVRVIDSYTVTMGMGLPVLYIARKAQTAASLDELAEYAQQALDNSFSLYVLKTLEYLRRGGRIGPAAAIIAGALKLHPILTIKDGLVVPLDKTRTFQKAVNRGIEHAEKHVAGAKKFAVAVIHMGAPEAAKELLAAVKAMFGSKAEEVFLAQSGPAIGTHAGPGSVGIATIRLAE